MAFSILDCELYKEDLAKCCNQSFFKQFINKSILITGATGLIGSAIVDLLLFNNLINKADNIIYLGTRNNNLYESKYKNYSFIKWINYDALQPIKFDIKLDYIICCAGIASPELYTEKPVETLLSNISGIKNLLVYAKHNSIKRILYISSSEIYGIKNEADSYEENSYGIINIDNIRSSYPIAKKTSEMICRAYSKEYGIDIVIARPGHIFGPTATEKDKRVSSEFAFLASKGVDLFLKSSGLQKRSYCYSLNCTVALLLILIKGNNCEAYNISQNDYISIKEMSSILAETGKVKLYYKEPTEEEKKSFNQMKNSSLDNNKLKSLGYNDIFSVKEGLEHTVFILKELNSLLSKGIK